MSTRKRKKETNILLFLALLFVLITTLVVSLYCLFFRGTPEEQAEVTEEEVSMEVETTEEEPEVPAVELQEVIDSWAESVGGNRSVLIYDLDRDEVAAEYNISEDYGTASLYKLFVVYEGYRRVQSGEWDEEEMVGATGQTILKCLDLAIRESNSACAEALWAKIGYAELDEIIREEFQITNSDISHLTSNAEDILKMMQIFYEHKEIVDENLVATIKDSFLNQPETTYDWRQGLPSGFSKADVYNKVGWEYNADGGYWNIYHDAAIVEFPEVDRSFIVVVMTNKVDFEDIADLGRRVEEQILSLQSSD